MGGGSWEGRGVPSGINDQVMRSDKNGLGPFILIDSDEFIISRFIETQEGKKNIFRSHLASATWQQNHVKNNLFPGIKTRGKSFTVGI
jgi:hypothetical protein